ncbi:CoA transferase [Phytohabitans sp. ZYX-F-186]|uniref:CoA transferase n=1 Tax=Phytohabitans maris TaxID=3071409 RepID=A0ABU0ZBT0_9ACTN|nr:CoA transferase [Phytohabitans sp. ZYX-F-186]MDQ7903782.1 CoA transferase [Phytohabitans sp. ZYX-F-186]
MYDVLSGVRVVELSTWTMVPSCGAVCAEWGAEVIKVEHPKGDPQRGIRFTPSRDEPAAMTMTHLPNRGKRSVALDLHAESGREVLLRLVASADVFLTNFLAPARRKLRIDVDDLRAANPGLVYAKATGQGPKGPEADLGGYDISAGWARPSMVDQMMAFGADEPPAMPPGMVDLQAGFNLAAGIAGALLKRERTGQPSVVDVSLLSAALWMLGPNLSAAAYGSEILHATGRYDPAHGALTNSYRTRDGRWLYLVFIEPDRYWHDFCRRVDRPDLATDPRFATAEVRARHVRECVEALDAVFASRTLEQWRAAFDGMEGPWAAVQTAAETVRDPQVLANDYLGDAGGFTLVSNPVQFDGRSVGEVAPAPAVGEHGDEVLAALGYDAGEIQAMRDKGVLG